MATTISRRSFLKVGPLGTLTLAAAGGLYRMTKTSSPPGKFVLDGEARSALSAIVPIVLNISATEGINGVNAAIVRVQDAIAGLPFVTQKEIQDLFALLTLGPTRRFLVGIPDDWSQAKPEQVKAFLQNWRTHRLGLLQSAYHALHDLILGPWYAAPSTWASIGYPGPIKELS
jgi:hypothetical protein